MHKFVVEHILQPFAGKWVRGFLLLALWTAAFIALPAISGWFLAICSVAFITASTTFSYLIPSAIIRLLALLRTATRYFERIENHKTTLDAQQRIQLRIFRAVAKFPYFKKQVNNNSTLLENSTQGVEQILNYILLWLLPLTALVVTLIIYFVFLILFSQVIAIEFLISAAILLFIVPQLFFRKNGKLYKSLKTYRDENNQELIQSFRGRIEISKYNMEEKVIGQYEQRLGQLERLENKLQTNSFYLQLIAGLGFSYIAAFLLWNSGNYGIEASTAIGIFFGIMAQAELSEMLFSGKSEKSSVKQQISDVESIIKQGEQPVETVQVSSALENLTLNGVSAKIPDTPVRTADVSLEIKKGEWIALFGETGKGKTTLLNSLFYPEYRRSGSLTWNSDKELTHLPVPEAVYVTQKAYLLTGTLRENFEGYPDEAIEQVLKTVDLSSWRSSLPDGLGSWLGENGETLSGGQRKKLLLAQALLKEPQLLVVDEPTAGISSENAIDIFRNIKSQYPDITILMATHLKDFEGVVDKVVRI
ncbi:ABC-type multidrug transport system [Proteiniphilum saccharofermentans]|uniref:ABC-type multidrug transport system n=1 Tax=Proteiniphilum saccharofermentans TaxID=1642647 RepID=A0A1R3T083_9BACT|nr:ATP-binding cassette domain-containing protein [Proteiniphilum saccharofermentans]SCD19549.1 ABC-type multidrug transport system [Proteiniphilum saccharofermentans]